MAEFSMPSLGADMDEGTLLEWLVHPGDTVARGDVVAVVETAKSTIEVECFDSGTVEALLVAPGTTVPVGTPLATIATAERPSPPAPSPPPPPPPVTPPSPSAPAGPAPEPEPEPAPALVAKGAAGDAATTPFIRHLAAEKSVDLRSVHGTGKGGRIRRSDIERAAPAEGNRVRVSPLARRLAQSLGVELATVRGTGTDGTIKADDVRAAAGKGARQAGEQAAAERAATEPAAAEPAAAQPPAAGRPSRTGGRAAEPAPGRQAIAALMTRAKRDIPHYYLSTTIDLAAATGWMREQNATRPVAQRLVPAALLLKGIALAALEVPELNGYWTDSGFVPGSGVRLGVAVSLRGGGLAAPALADADRMSVQELMAALRDVVARARNGRLRASETTDPTLTVTNLGDQGVEAVFGVIYPPQVALVGLGRVTERAVAVNGMLTVRPTVTATLSADHRASDGATGGRFLTAFDRLLQQPEDL